MKKHILKKLIKEVLLTLENSNSLSKMENPSGDKWNPLRLVKTFKKDRWQRPIYVDRDNVTYVDITLGKEKEPQLYTVTDQGEPNYPVRNYKIETKPNTGEYSHSPEMRVRSDEPSTVSESLKPSGIATIQKWCNEIKDNRKVGVKLIDFILNKKVGLSSADLPDTATFAGGLDSIEEALDSNDYQGAFDIAKDTVTEMLQDEGFGMDESTEPSIGGSFKDQQTSCGGAEITQFERDPLTDPRLKK